MRPLSSRIRSFERSPIRSIMDTAANLPDAIHLELGQPDFPTPSHVIEAAVDAARHAYTGYTANSGMYELRQAVVTKLARDNDLHVSPENVMITTGAMEAVFATLLVLLDYGDEVLLPDPGYGNFVMAAKAVQGTPKAYPTLPSEGFIPDLHAMQEMVSGRTRALLINSPSNPTGAVYSENVLRRCLEFCQRHDLHLISDETYDRLVFEGEHVSPAKWDTEGRVVSIFSLSKTYAMTGWRVGYAVGNAEIVAAMAKVQEPLVSCVNTVAQHAAIAALAGPQDCVREMLRHYRRRRDLAVNLAAQHGLKVSYPQGAFYLLVDISSQPRKSLDFCRSLLQAEHVAVAPGCAFGDSCDGYVRVSFSVSDEALSEGMTRLARHLWRLSRGHQGALAFQCD